MTRFAELHTHLTDNLRTRKIAQDEARRVERQFAPIKARAARNVTTMRSTTGWMTIA
jgi:hypothetical protein